MDTHAAERADETLMAALAGGDDSALATLMERWELPLKGFLFRLLGNAADADDLAQETFVRLYKNRARFAPGARLSPFLYSIASNLAKNRLRWQSVRRIISLETAKPDHPALQVPDPDATSGAERAMENERADAVRNAIAALPMELRAPLVLAEYEGLSHGEIAAALDCTVKAVEGRLHRARGALRRSLTKWIAAP